MGEELSQIFSVILNINFTNFTKLHKNNKD